jgi:hypothetical protein
MPNLNTLNWNGWMDHRDQPPCHGDVDFLRQCQFTGLRTVAFTLLREKEPSKADAESFRDLLSSWTKDGHIQDLKIYLHSSQLSAVIPRLRCSVISFVYTRLDPKICKLLHPETAGMVLILDENDVANLFLLLHGLAERTEPFKLQYIRIISFLSYLPTFSWSCRDNDPLQLPRQTAEFLGRMLLLTLRLNARGIRIVDEHGFAIFSSL